MPWHGARHRVPPPSLGTRMTVSESGRARVGSPASACGSYRCRDRRSFPGGQCAASYSPRTP
ncbi:hypothetical protein MINT15_13410 [Saccharomonospora viridis]|uniref:Uncharacterized protein n=1 Tax=Saccharomonospora viridis TaxID=1852 RepID=A0A837D9B5_9PSEU|nr:hypothetical protein MINT15_13410 [Saccharomonospora viridis]